MTQDDYDWLKRNLTENNAEPNDWFLEHCFRDASKELQEFTERENLESWSLEAVASYWHQHQGLGGDCAVKKAIVCSPIQLKGFLVIAGSETFVVINLYDLDLQIGDTVLVHKRIVVERAD